jgi:4-nitrotryptophan synthase
MQSQSPLMNPEIVADPYPTYAALLRDEPVHWCDGLGGWAVFRHQDCVDALSDPRLKAERMGSVLNLKFPGNNLPSDSIYHRFTKNVMMYADPPLHGALRNSTQPAFTRSALEYYSSVIEAVAKDLVRSIPASGAGFDVISDLTGKMPVACAIHAFGVPEEDLDKILPLVENIMTYWSGPVDQPLALKQLLKNLEDLHVYCHELVRGDQGRVLPNTVIDRLTSAPGDASVTIDQTIHQLVLLLIALFAPTTPGSLSSGLLSFAKNRAQVDRLRSDRRCAENAANEVVRYNASNQFTWRIAAEALEISGVKIESGQAVILFLGAANRDPRVFERPNEFDIGRENSGRNLSFGGGRHSCLGRQIAVLEINWFFTALFDRFSRAHLATTPQWNPNLEFRSLKSLEIEFN